MSFAASDWADNYQIISYREKSDLFRVLNNDKNHIINHIVSKTDIETIIISSQKFILKLKNDHIISKNDVETSKIIILSQQRYADSKIILRFKK